MGGEASKEGLNRGPSLAAGSCLGFVHIDCLSRELWKDGLHGVGQANWDLYRRCRVPGCVCDAKER